jgi:hypothetical protein
MEEVAQNCQAILQEKVRLSEHTGSCIRVLATSIHFMFSRLKVEETLLVSRPGARVEGSPDELDLVPAAGCEFYSRSLFECS